MMRNIVFFIHTQVDIPARLGDIFEECGFSIQTICTPSTDLKSFDALKPDLLVIMGGDMGVYESDEHPYLLDETEIIKTRIAHDAPTLGVCLGAQLIAYALGATVYKGQQGFEIGWHKLSVTEEGENSAARHMDQAHTDIMQWHQDTFPLPEGATLLARGTMYENQIFSYGRSIMAIQGHPEADIEPQLVKWTEGEDNRDEILEQAKEKVPIMDKQFRKFMHEWLNHVGLVS